MLAPSLPMMVVVLAAFIKRAPLGVAWSDFPRPPPPPPPSSLSVPFRRSNRVFVCAVVAVCGLRNYLPWNPGREGIRHTKGMAKEIYTMYE